MPAEYNKSMEMFLDVVQKLPLISATDLMLTLHISPPMSPNVSTDIQDTLRAICAAAKQQGATVHLRQAPKNDDFIRGGSSDAGGAMLKYVAGIGAGNLRVALQVGLLLKHQRSAEEVAALYKVRVAYTRLSPQ
jgi:hypothetical protein